MKKTTLMIILLVVLASFYTIFALTPACTGNPPSFAQLCAGDAQNLDSSTSRTLARQCSSVKCEYTCLPGFSIVGNTCAPTRSDNAPHVLILQPDYDTVMYADGKLQVQVLASQVPPTHELCFVLVDEARSQSIPLGQGIASLTSHSFSVDQKTGYWFVRTYSCGVTANDASFYTAQSGLFSFTQASTTSLEPAVTPVETPVEQVIPPAQNEIPANSPCMSASWSNFPKPVALPRDEQQLPGAVFDKSAFNSVELSWTYNDNDLSWYNGAAKQGQLFAYSDYEYFTCPALRHDVWKVALLEGQSPVTLNLRVRDWHQQGELKSLTIEKGTPEQFQTWRESGSLAFGTPQVVQLAGKKEHNQAIVLEPVTLSQPQTDAYFVRVTATNVEDDSLSTVFYVETADPAITIEQGTVIITRSSYHEQSDRMKILSDTPVTLNGELAPSGASVNDLDFIFEVDGFSGSYFSEFKLQLLKGTQVVKENIIPWSSVSRWTELSQPQLELIGPYEPGDYQLKVIAKNTLNQIETKTYPITIAGRNTFRPNLASFKIYCAPTVADLTVPSTSIDIADQYTRGLVGPGYNQCPKDSYVNVVAGIDTTSTDPRMIALGAITKQTLEYQTDYKWQSGPQNGQYERASFGEVGGSGVIDKTLDTRGYVQGQNGPVKFVIGNLKYLIYTVEFASGDKVSYDVSLSVELSPVVEYEEAQTQMHVSFSANVSELNTNPYIDGYSNSLPGPIVVKYGKDIILNISAQAIATGPAANSKLIDSILVTMRSPEPNTPVVILWSKTYTNSALATENSVAIIPKEDYISANAKYPPGLYEIQVTVKPNWCSDCSYVRTFYVALRIPDQISFTVDAVDKNAIETPLRETEYVSVQLGSRLDIDSQITLPGTEKATAHRFYVEGIGPISPPPPNVDVDGFMLLGNVNPVVLEAPVEVRYNSRSFFRQPNGGVAGTGDYTLIYAVKTSTGRIIEQKRLIRVVE